MRDSGRDRGRGAEEKMGGSEEERMIDAATRHHIIIIIGHCRSRWWWVVDSLPHNVSFLYSYSPVLLLSVQTSKNFSDL